MCFVDVWTPGYEETEKATGLEELCVDAVEECVYSVNMTMLATCLVHGKSSSEGEMCRYLWRARAMIMAML